MAEDNEMENNMENETPQQILKENLDSLHSELQEILSNVHGDDEIENLKKQAKVLNKVMLRMLSDADEQYSNMVHIQYGLALRAQNQYRQTVQTIDTLNRRAEKEWQKQQQLDEDSRNFREYGEANLTKNLEDTSNNFSVSRQTNYTDLPHKED